MQSKLRELCRSVVAEAWQNAQKDANFRMKLLADPEETMSAAGLEEINDFINKLKTADAAAIEKALTSGESNPTC